MHHYIVRIDLWSVQKSGMAAILMDDRSFGQVCISLKKGCAKMDGKKTILTAEGLRKYEDELNNLKVNKRKEIAQAIKEARAQGDLSENAEYQAAKDEQRLIEARIDELENILADVEVVEEETGTPNIIRIGSKVRIKDIEYDEILEYRIVGSNEANTDAGQISNESPLGHALIGAAVGKMISVSAPMGDVKYQVMELMK